MDVVDIRVGQYMAGLWACVAVQSVSPDHWGHPSQVRAGASSPIPMLSVSVLPHLWWGVRPSLSSVGTSSLAEMSSFPRASEGLSELSMAFWFQHAWFLRPPLVKCATDNNRPQLLQDHTLSLSLWHQPWPWMLPWSQVTGSAIYSECHSPSGSVAIAPTRPQVVIILVMNKL